MIHGSPPMDLHEAWWLQLRCPWVEVMIAILICLEWGKNPQNTKSDGLKCAKAQVGSSWYPLCVCVCVLQSFAGRPQKWVWKHFEGYLMVLDTFSDKTAPSDVSTVEPVLPHPTFPGGKRGGVLHLSCVRQDNDHGKQHQPTRQDLPLVTSVPGL